MARIRTLVTPSKLYRYRAVSDRPKERQELAALEEGYLWCSEFRSMNDPMEGLYEADRSFRLDPRYSIFRDDILNNKQDVGICSFSESPTNELMWAHYADQFRGICVEYDMHGLLRNLPDGVDMVRVHYDERMPEISLDGGRPSDLARKILSCKNHRWLYEREWRVLAGRGRADYREPDCVTNVRIGPRMPDAARKRIEDRLRRLGIPCSLMEVAGYRLAPAP
jgi:Protein of unknown function (DUF2971)